MPSFYIFIFFFLNSFICLKQTTFSTWLEYFFPLAQSLGSSEQASLSQLFLAMGFFNYLSSLLVHARADQIFRKSEIKLHFYTNFYRINLNSRYKKEKIRSLDWIVGDRLLSPCWKNFECNLATGVICGLLQVMISSHRHVLKPFQT